MRLLLALLLALIAGWTRADAQAVELRGGEGDRAVELIREIQDRATFLLIDRDTLFPASAVIQGDLIIVDADVRLEGTITGDVAVIQGALFVRPGARIDGRVAVAGGEVFASGLATVGEVLRVPPEVAVRRDPWDGGHGITLEPASPAPRLVLDGFSGLGLPSYDRVNGLTVRVGGRAHLGPDRDGARLRAAGLYHSARGALGGEAALEVPLRGGVWLEAAAARRTATNEAWIRGDLANSLAALVLGSDARDYYHTDEVALSLVRRPPQPVIQGEWFLGPRLGLRASRDRSLDARHPWSLFGGEWRENPPVLDGTLASVVGGAGVIWRGQTSRFDGDVGVEWAPHGWADLQFAQLLAEARWDMQALWGHRIQFYGRTLQPLGGRPAPPQRWSSLGGSNTLPTLEYGALRGDHLVFLESVYTVPFPRLQLPLLGPPSLQVVHAAGTAWRTDQDAPRWEQNLGLGAAFSVLEAALYIDPASPSTGPSFNVGLALPF